MAALVLAHCRWSRRRNVSLQLLLSECSLPLWLHQVVNDEAAHTEPYQVPCNPHRPSMRERGEHAEQLHEGSEAGKDDLNDPRPLLQRPHPPSQGCIDGSKNQTPHAKKCADQHPQARSRSATAGLRNRSTDNCAQERASDEGTDRKQQQSACSDKVEYCYRGNTARPLHRSSSMVIFDAETLCHPCPSVK